MRQCRRFLRVRSHLSRATAVSVLVGAGSLTLAAAEAQAESAFSTRGTIVRLAADGDRVAASTRGIKGACDRIVVWRAPGKTFRRFDARTHCPGSDAPVFSYVGELALGGGRVVWIEGGGGNSLELSLYAAPLSGGPKSAKDLDFAANNNGAEGNRNGAWIGQLFGAGPMLGYNRWRECWREHDDDTSCPVNGEVSKQQLLRIGSAKPTQVLSGQSAWRLVAVGGGRLALLTEGLTKAAGDSLTIRSAGGALLATIPATPSQSIRTVALGVSALVVQRKPALDVYDPATGAARATYPLGKDSPLRLVGTAGDLALLRGFRRLLLVRLSDGKRITLPLAPGAQKCACPVDAKLTEHGLFYAYNVPNATARGRIVFWPSAQLAGRF